MLEKYFRKEKKIVKNLSLKQISGLHNIIEMLK